MISIWGTCRIGIATPWVISLPDASFRVSALTRIRANISLFNTMEGDTWRRGRQGYQARISDLEVRSVLVKSCSFEGTAWLLTLRHDGGCRYSATGSPLTTITGIAQAQVNGLGPCGSVSPAGNTICFDATSAGLSNHTCLLQCSDKYVRRPRERLSRRLLRF